MNLVPSLSIQGVVSTYNRLLLGFVQALLTVDLSRQGLGLSFGTRLHHQMSTSQEQQPASDGGLPEASKAEHALFWVSGVVLPVIIFSQTLGMEDREENTVEAIQERAINDTIRVWTPVACALGIYSISALSASRRILYKSGKRYRQYVQAKWANYGCPSVGGETSETSDRDASKMLSPVMFSELIFALLICAFYVFLLLSSESSSEEDQVLGSAFASETFIITIIYVLTVVLKVLTTRGCSASRLTSIQVILMVTAVLPSFTIVLSVLASPFALLDQICALLVVVFNSKLFPANAQRRNTAPGSRGDQEGVTGINASKLEHMLYWINAVTAGLFPFLVGTTVSSFDEAILIFVLLYFGLFLFIFDVASIMALSESRNVYVKANHSRCYHPYFVMSSKLLCCPRCFRGEESDARRTHCLTVLLEGILLTGLVAALIYVELEVFPFISSQPQLILLPAVELLLVSMKIIGSRSVIIDLLKSYGPLFPFALMYELLQVFLSVLLKFPGALPEQLLILFYVLKYAPAYPEAAGDLRSMGATILVDLA